jgi:AbrB family looped-hinge helix DNA binding protein
MHNPQVQQNKLIQQCRTQIANNGRLNIPASLRKAAHINDGDEVVLTLKDDHTILMQPLSQVIAEAQAIVAEYFSEDDLIAELKELRVADASREAEKIQDKE